MTYGKALNYNFKDDFPEMPDNLMEEPEEVYSEPATIADAVRQRDKWKEKYYSLLEKHQKLLEEKLKWNEAINIYVAVTGIAVYWMISPYYN